MNFKTSIKVCFSKSLVFSGRASRAEFWWFLLFRFLISIVPVVGWMLSVLTILPAISVSVRRLHDINRSGWYLLPIFILPLLCFYVLLSLTSAAANGEIAMRLMEMTGSSDSNQYIFNAMINGVYAPTFLFFTAVYLLYNVMLLLWVIRKGDKKANEYGIPPL